MPLPTMNYWELSFSLRQLENTTAMACPFFSLTSQQKNISPVTYHNKLLASSANFERSPFSRFT